MPVYKVQAPNGRIYSVEGPEGASEGQLFQFVQSQMQATPQNPEDVGILSGTAAALKRGIGSFGDIAEGYGLAGSSLFGNEAEAQRKMEAIKKEAAAPVEKPSMKFADLERLYKEKGIGSALSNVPKYITEQFAESAPQMAVPLAVGAGAAAVSGPLAPIVGPVAGIGAYGLQQFGSLMQRQAQEKESAKDLNVGKAAAAAAIQAPIGYLADRFALGVGGLGERGIAEVTKELAARKAAGEIGGLGVAAGVGKQAVKGAAEGFIVEAPTEALEQVLERWQAGLPLSNSDAMNEYKEAFMGAGAIGGVGGAASRGYKTLSGMKQADMDQQILDQQKQEQEFEAERVAAAENAGEKQGVYTLPGGYEVKPEEAGQFEAPIAHHIMEEGGTEPLVSVKTEDEVAPKMERLKKIRLQEAEKSLQEIDKINEGIQKQTQEVEVMEATGQTNTPEYAAAKERLELSKTQADTQAKDLMARVETLGKPLVYVPGEVQAQTKQQFVLSKDGQTIGAFDTLQEAEQTVRNTLGPEAFAQAVEEQQQQQKQRLDQESIARLKAQLRPMMDKFGLKDVGLNVVDKLENDAGGSYFQNLVKVALNEPAPIRTMRHESVHALKDLGFFTPQQWTTLESMAKNQWIDKYLGGQQTEVDGQQMSRLEGYRKLGLSENDIIEEAIADAFGDFDVNKAPPGMLSALYKKLKAFFEAMKNGFSGAGFQTAESVFHKIEGGHLKPSKTAQSKQVKYSLAGEGIPMSTRKFMERQTPVSQQELGLKTEAKRGRFNNVRDIAKALNRNTLEQIGEMDRSKMGQDESTRIAESIADEVAYQLGTTSKTGTGLGWYSNNYPNAVKRLAKRFPELGTNKHARSVFSALVAVTSNGERVAKNIDNAIKLYSKLRDGKSLVAMGNRRATALQENLQVIQDLLAEHKENFEQVLLKEITVKDMNARLREMGEKTDSSYLANTVVPAAAVYFGPKLGAFYANLSGSEGYLTMDLWWTRSINRMRGLLIPKATDASIDKFRDMMDRPDATREEVVAATIPLRDKYEEYGWNSELEHLVGAKEPSKKNEKTAWFEKAQEKAGDSYEQLLFEHSLEKMANTIYKNEFEMLEEAPFSATDRKFMYDAARKAQTLLRNEGIDLSLADIQAALWYYEKRLYAKLSGRKADDIGYEEAIIAQANKGNGRARPSVVFSEKSDRGAEPQGKVEGVEAVREQPASQGKLSIKRGVLAEVAPNPDHIDGKHNIETKLSLKNIGTPQFKQWFGDSTVVNRDGTPKVMYHGLAKDTTDFTRKTERGAPIFLTDDPDFAAGFATDSYMQVASHPEKYLTREQMAEGEKRAIAAIRKDYRKDTLGKEMIESIREGAPTAEAREYLQKEYVTMLPSGPHIMPLYVRAERPFDYNNPAHVRSVANLVKDYGNIISLGDGRMVKSKDLATILREGDWNTIESEDVQNAIKELGFDSFYVKEHGRKNLAVYEPNQVKSATGNTGEYSRVNNDVRYSLKKLNTPEFKRWFGDSKVVDEDGQPLVVYHGTINTPTEFEGGIGQTTASGIVGWFTTSPSQAERFALERAEGADYDPDYEVSGPTIMPAYLSMQNPIDLDRKDHLKLLEQQIKLPQTKAGSRWVLTEGGIGDLVIDAAKRLGFDSLMVKEDGIQTYAAFRSEQIKSATGNIGTYDPNNPDIRYSLKKVSFATPEEALKAVKEAGIPDTPEFKQFAHLTQVATPDGKPMVLYHGTSREFFEFQPAGLSQAIFLSEAPADAQKYAVKDRERIREMAYKALTKDEKVEFFDRVTEQAVEDGDIDSDEAADIMRKVKRAAPAYGSFGSIEKNVLAELDALSPSKPNIMPLFVSGLNLFNYENPQHVQGISNWVLNKTDILATMQNPDHLVRGLPALIAQGWRKTIAGGEKADERNQKIANYIQQAIRANGFDGFMVRENQAGEKSYAVYKPTQLKSVTGNDGSFDGELKDVRYSLSKIRYSDDRFERLLNSSTTTNNGEEKTAKKYLAFIDPLDFVRATSNLEKYYSLQNELEPVDFVKMRELGPITLMVGVDKDGEWKIKGHEGRHRMLALNNAGYRDVPVVIDFESNVKNAEPIKGKFLLSQEADSVARSVLVTDIEPLSIDNTDRAKAKFTRLDSKPTKYSLPNISAGAEGRINATTSVREEKGYVERMINVLKGESASTYRQQFLNRYNRLGEADRLVAQQRGGLNLMATESAEHAALMSDMSAGVTASAFGIGGRRGGVPVIKNGFTTIDHNQKGLMEIFMPLAKYNDPKAYRYFQFYSAVKRGARLYSEGREKVIQPGDIAFAQELAQKFPEFEQIRKDWVQYNNALIKYQKDAGVLSAQDAIEYTKHYDYIPFFRQVDGERTIGPNIYQSISGVKKPKKLQGGEAPLADFLETVVRNSQSAIAAGMKNIAAQRAIDVGKQAGVVHVPQPGKVISDFEKIKVLENGILKEYQCDDQLFVDAVKSLHMPDIPFLGLLSAPSNFLREAVTREPGFILANLMRDSLSAYATSGQKFTPVVDTIKNFGNAMARKSPGFEALLDAGVIGGYEFSENVEQSGRTVAKELAKRAGNKGSPFLRPFTSVWDGLEKATTASDAATRIAVYDRVMKETGNEAEAIRAAWEIMNFNRKGSSPIIRVLTAAVPFLNARLQGLDVFYRAATGKMTTSDPKVIQRRFIARASMMFATSFLYAAAVAGEPDYEDQEQETKDNNWIIPGINGKIPIPFEVGTLFKTIPERIYRYAFGNDTGQDLQSALVRAFNSTIPISPWAYIPQVAKPLIEAKTNYSFFTDREIVGQGMKDVAPEFQVGPGTSAFAEWAGKSFGLSPLKVDHVLKAYSGTMGMYAIDVMDSIMNVYSDSPKPTKRFEQMPVIKRFMADPEARGNVTAYYKLKDEVDTVVRTMNLLEKSMKPEEYAEYLEENIGALAFKDQVRDMEKSMKEFREMRKMISSSPMSGEEKTEVLTAIGQAENNLTANIQTIKKAISEVR